MPTLLVWIVGYLVMDAVYVTLSRGFYAKAIARVSRAPTNVAKVALCALGAYALMAVGWAKIVAPVVKKGRILQAAQAGALYGLVLYGVFNFTTGAMFNGWGWGVMLRDTVWGTVSVAAYTALYAAFKSAR
jgi:uncharacterized membrane protein